ncbi:MAG TPA: hypothetical protein VFA33_16670 [Bryobacteraceae bacterium]|nr:hypothetical protein [Bryobacteraceae bacterium]
MTKVQIHFRLRKPLNDNDFSRLENLHSKYGIFRIQLDTSLEGLAVEYDATRLQPPDVEATLAGAGIPIQSAN